MITLCCVLQYMIWHLHWLPISVWVEYKITTLAYGHFDETLPPSLTSTRNTYSVTGCPILSVSDWVAEKLLKVPVIDHWWQTETGWPIAANCLGIEQLPIKPGSPTKPMPGYDVRILDDEGNELGPNQEGNIVVKLPLPPGTLATLWKNEDRFISCIRLFNEIYTSFT